MPAPVRSARAALTDGLRQSRRDAGLTGAALAARIGAGWGQPKVSKIESGRQFPTADDVRAWALATDVPDQPLLELHARALHEYHAFRDTYGAEGGAVHQQEIYAAAEAAASVIIGFQPVIMHGLLQTPEYARALLSLPGGPASHGSSADEIDRVVAARMRRSSILYEPGRRILIIIGEAALHTRVGTPEVMRGQLDHLVRLLKSTPHVTIAILPFEAFPVLALHGWDQRDDVVTLETTAGDLEVADPPEVRQYASWAQLMGGTAVTGPRAIALCQQVADSVRRSR